MPAATMSCNRAIQHSDLLTAAEGLTEPGELSRCAGGDSSCARGRAAAFTPEDSLRGPR